MSKPEIDRRCKACGSSIREAAAFCPQCGEEIAPPDHRPQTTSAVTTPLVELATGEGEAKPKGQTALDKEHQKPTGKAAATSSEQPTARMPIKTPAVIGRQAPVGKVRDTIQRAATRARDVEGDVIHRVQKVRQISSVVLDEAGYDPSLRFLLVAAVLFILFLLVLLLNKLIG